MTKEKDTCGCLFYFQEGVFLAIRGGMCHNEKDEF